jgi:RNA recognition motif-containing protein
MHVRPLHDRILVQRLEEGEQRVGGIIIPDSAKEKPQRGTVIAAGNGKRNDTGRARGFAFVEMTTDEEAQTAIAKLNEYQLGGRALAVNEARPKADQGGGFGVGSGGGGRRRSEPRW